MNPLKHLFILALCFIFSHLANAKPSAPSAQNASKVQNVQNTLIVPEALNQSSQFEYIKIPHCLAQHVPASYPILAYNAAFSIVKIPEHELYKMTQLADRIKCGRFINVSDEVIVHGQFNLDRAVKTLTHVEQQSNQPFNAQPAQLVLAHADEVNAAMQHINMDELWSWLTHLTQYMNRSATQDTGVETANWLKATVDQLALDYNRQDISTYFVKAGRYKQPSLVMVIGQDIAAPAVVIGAHMDTLDGYMPGAGDDGSGSATILETYKAILASDIKFKRPIYIIWYAAEERGLVGSHDVVMDFLKKNIPVLAVMQYDMTGYRRFPNDRTMWIYKDYTDSTLNAFVADLIKTYVNVPVKYSQCGYGCSDHASWTRNGFSATFPCETSYEDHNPNIHTSRDTLSLLNQDHLNNFTKLSLAFIIELGLNEEGINPAYSMPH